MRTAFCGIFRAMPAHFTHLLFAEDALRGAFGEKAQDILDAHGNLFRFGAQGPDFFYHNQRTMPTGLRYGVALHHRSFGTFVEQMTREALRLGEGPGSELSAFIMGFATHGPLDRRAHPYIGFFAGWDDPEHPGRHREYHAHPFFERIIDVLVLKERRGMSLDEFDFLPLVRCGRTLPYPVVKALVKGFHSVYPSFSYKSRDRLRVENAYHDSIFFYKLTNHRNADLPRLVVRKDRKEGFKNRRLGLIHPREIPPGYDFLNLRHESWCHPCDASAESQASFLDLYDEALAECVGMLKDLHAALAGQAPPDGLGERVGNQNLDTGRESCAPEHARPFPLAEILDGMYAKMEREAARSC